LILPYWSLLGVVIGGKWNCRGSTEMGVSVGTGFGLPAGSDGWTDWTWFHARYPLPQRFTILCEEPVSYSGHFRKGRMVPCSGEECPHCAMGLGSQARYVFSVVEWESRRVGLLELGRGHALQIQDWIGEVGALRGMSFEMVRSGSKRQSALTIVLLRESVPLFFRHLEGPDLVRAVKSTWERHSSSSLEEDPSRRERERVSA
jgi:hypothetical protein